MSLRVEVEWHCVASNSQEGGESDGWGDFISEYELTTGMDKGEFDGLFDSNAQMDEIYSKPFVRKLANSVDKTRLGQSDLDSLEDLLKALAGRYYTHIGQREGNVHTNWRVYVDDVYFWEGSTLVNVKDIDTRPYARSAIGRLLDQ